MPVVINITASEDSNIIRDALTNPTPNAAIAEAFQYVERGDMGGRSRTPLNGEWIGAIAIARRADGTAEAQRTWSLTDAQAASSGLTNDAAVRAFAVRLADDVRASLRQRASRNQGGAVGDFWTVGASAGSTAAQNPSTPLGQPGAQPPSSNVGWWALAALVAGVGAVWVYGGKR